MSLQMSFEVSKCLLLFPGQFLLPILLKGEECEFPVFSFQLHLQWLSVAMLLHYDGDELLPLRNGKSQINPFLYKLPWSWSFTTKESD